MDPRIRARRAQVRRDAGRRRLRLLVGAVASLAVVGAGWGATRSPLLDVEDVRVSGAELTGRDAVVAAAGLGPHRLMADVDEREAVRRVEALPWVARAEVRRRWPDRVEVRVEERRAAAVAPAAVGTWALTDVSGRVLAEVGAPPPGLIELRGVAPLGAPGTAVPPETRGALAVVGALADAPPGAEVVAVEARQGELDLALAAGPTVRFGAPVLVEEKLTALRTLAERLRLDDVVTVDVRVPHAPALTRRQANG